jgi:hypothetical protein
MSTIVNSAHYDALWAREWNPIHISDLILCEGVYSLLTTLTEQWLQRFARPLLMRQPKLDLLSLRNVCLYIQQPFWLSLMTSFSLRGHLLDVYEGS